MIRIHDEYHHIHLKMPILEIWTTHDMVVEIFELLKLNGAKISNFDNNFERKQSIISINDGALYISLEQKTGEDDQMISFYESGRSLHPHLLHIVLNFAREKGLKIIANKIDNIYPENFPLRLQEKD
ncbi:MAG: hypothetical protein ACFFDC_01095 [Promethearchaeota archaeon]